MLKNNHFYLIIVVFLVYLLFQISKNFQDVIDLHAAFLI